MKYTTLLCLLAALIISLSLTGCSRDPKPTEQDSEPEVSLELGEDNSEKEENTKPSLAQLGGEDNEKESSEENKEEEVKSETQLPSSQGRGKTDRRSHRKNPGTRTGNSSLPDTNLTFLAAASDPPAGGTERESTNTGYPALCSV